jgi:acyl transferase domain-containing protein
MPGGNDDISDVLRSGVGRPAAPHLHVLAAKSIVGHGEPASGLLGIQAVIQQATQQAALPIMHLTTVNPHVVDAAVATSSARLSAPRQQQPVLPPQAHHQGSSQAGSDGLAINVGVSAFAFQGTNAHAVLSIDACDKLTSASGNSPGSHKQQKQAELVWERMRMWPHPLPLPLVDCAMLSPKVGLQNACCL